MLYQWRMFVQVTLSSDDTETVESVMTEECHRDNADNGCMSLIPSTAEDASKT